MEANPAVTLGFYNIHEVVKNLDEKVTAEITALSSDAMHVQIESDPYHYLLALYEDYVNSQRFTDPHTKIYLTRLVNEMKLVDACRRIQPYFSRNDERLYHSVLLLQLRLVYSLRRSHTNQLDTI